MQLTDFIMDAYCVVVLEAESREPAYFIILKNEADGSTKASIFR